MRAHLNIQTPSMKLYSLVFQSILKPEADRIQHKVDRLCSRNHELGASSNTIICDGKTLFPTRRLMAVRYDPPHPTLKNETVELVQYMNKFAKDREYISQVFSFLVPPHADMQQIRDSVSDLIADYIPALNKIPRKNKEAFYIRHNVSKMKQWYKAKESLEHYIGNLLVFS